MEFTKACSAGFAEVVGELIKRGADPNAKNRERETALHKAAINGHEQVAKALLLRNVDFNAKVLNKPSAVSLSYPLCLETHPRQKVKIRFSMFLLTASCC
jgi:ankyrin repeat protein